MVKLLLKTIFVAFLGLTVSCSFILNHPIKKETTKIEYYHWSGSGSAISEEYGIYTNKIVWEYVEARNNFHLRDSITYDSKDFDELIDALSRIRFSVRASEYSRGVGGSVFRYTFSIDSTNYLIFDKENEFSGDIDAVRTLIMNFIKNHPTKAESVFHELAEKPHQKGEFGVFKKVPKKLKKYQVK